MGGKVMTPSTINRKDLNYIKRLAKHIRKRDNIQHTMALESIVKALGFTSWNEACLRVKKNDP
jgi:hypothetical protein